MTCEAVSKRLSIELSTFSDVLSNESTQEDKVVEATQKVFHTPPQSIELTTKPNNETVAQDRLDRLTFLVGLKKAINWYDQKEIKNLCEKRPCISTKEINQIFEWILIKSHFDGFISLFNQLTYYFPIETSFYQKILDKTFIFDNPISCLSFLKPHLEINTPQLMDKMIEHRARPHYSEDEYELLIRQMIDSGFMTTNEYANDHLERHFRLISDDALQISDENSLFRNHLLTVFGDFKYNNMPYPTLETLKCCRVFSRVVKDFALNKETLISTFSSIHRNWTRGFFYFNASTACIDIAKCLSMTVREVRAIAERPH